MKSKKSNSRNRESVHIRIEEIRLPTYLPAWPDKNPMFLENRVYQGSSGRIYPLPFTDRIAEKPVLHRWKALWIENEYLVALILPELGGRIHALQDKTNGYDLIYRQPVIKPALVGLAGPWISGGIEFNWPQHHRPATFLPVDYEVESHADGSKTVWCSDHDPIARMKGMHGVCLSPGKAYLELKVRAYNRTPFPQTFLWWANVATRVHEAYQSFFPPDVTYVADHARRSNSEYPFCRNRYYGVNYSQRAKTGLPAADLPTQFVPLLSKGKTPVNYRPNDLSFYANIPVPTSYMCMESQKDFFGGYDHRVEAGLVHFANHHISPGKKQWTWGNHEFGYAWDRNLTEPNEKGQFDPYIELMAGVYTDNQPDFSFLQPGETKSWSQFWYPIHKIGPVQEANLQAAVSLILANGSVRIGVCVTQEQRNAQVFLTAAGKVLWKLRCSISPGRALVKTLPQPKNLHSEDLLIRVVDSQGVELIRYQHQERIQRTPPPAATEPALPSAIKSADELYLTGVHLDQYRHATRSPVLYWREALRRDPLDARCNNALGLWHLRRGETDLAEECFRKAIQRLTRRNPNPIDGEVFYNLGLCLRSKGKIDEAYGAFYKATWNQAWSGAGHHALGEIDCCRGAWALAEEHLRRGLSLDGNNLRVRNLLVLVLRNQGKMEHAQQLLNETLRLDPLDWWAHHLNRAPLSCDLQTALDVAHDYARAGFYDEATALLRSVRARRGDLPDQSWGAAPIIEYTLGWLEEKRRNLALALKHFQKAAELAPDYCFPARQEEIEILNLAIERNPSDARAPYYLGNLLYDRRRHQEAIEYWERAAQLDPKYAVVWRNLGVAYFNVRQQPRLAERAYRKARLANPDDARLLYEQDQLRKRLRSAPAHRLRELGTRLDLVEQRDDLTVELCMLYNQTGEHEKAVALLSRRRFQPWEGGEGGPLGQHVRAQLSMGRTELAQKNFKAAQFHFESALCSPENLGEAKHLLANQSDIHYLLGCAFKGLGEKQSAHRHWMTAATFKGDFQEMRVRQFSEMTYYSALAWRHLGRSSTADSLLQSLLRYAQELYRMQAKVDYFATSLPTMLLFNDDLQSRQQTTALFLQAQAHLGLGHHAKGRSLLRQVLRRDPNHALAADLMRGVSDE